MQQRGDEGVAVHVQLRQDLHHGDRVLDERLPAPPPLPQVGVIGHLQR
jgi:hypothetical protein